MCMAKGAEKWESSHLAGKRVWPSFKNSKVKLPYDPANLPIDMYPQRVQNVHPKTCTLHTDIYSSITYNNQRVGTTKCLPTNKWIKCMVTAIPWNITQSRKGRNKALIVQYGFVRGASPGRPHTKGLHSCEMCRVRKPTDRRWIGGFQRRWKGQMETAPNRGSLRRDETSGISTSLLTY
jgi:hypothetical protein